MTDLNGFRHELKFPVDTGEYLAIRQRLRPVMRPDPHAGDDGRYAVHSIYFDNYRDRALREKREGISEREKYRIRWYDRSLDIISVEKKHKIDSLCRKTAAPISEEQLRALLDGDTGWMRNYPAGLVRELYSRMKTRLLRPRVLVSYMREAYVFPAGNVRVTFDSRLRTSMWNLNLLDSPARVDPLGDPGGMLMEVKFDGFLPEVINMLLQEDVPRVLSFSKYSVCRRFG